MNTFALEVSSTKVGIPEDTLLLADLQEFIISEFKRMKKHRVEALNSSRNTENQKKKLARYYEARMASYYCVAKHLGIQEML